MEKFKKIVLNVPHASIEGLCDSELSYWNLSAEFFNDCILTWTDWFSDYLFQSNDNRIVMVRFPLSRFIVDAERLLNDPMERIGQGIVYTDFVKYHRSFPKCQDALEQTLMRKWYEHQKNLIDKLSDEALLIDCHSFPERLSDVDICIGYNNDWSKPDSKTIDVTSEIFKSYKYKVGINNPYSNSITPQTTFRYKSFMIEVNKRVYLQPGDNSLALDSSKVSIFKSAINEIYKELL